jgi:chromosome segregation ATPase
MMAPVLRLALVLAALGLPAAVAAQGLGDTAARERERREKEQQAKKGEEAPVYTNHDLDAIRPPDADDDSEDGDSTASEASDSREETPSRPVGRIRGRDDDLRPYRDGLSNAQAEVDQIQAQIQELNGKLNPMSRDYVYGAAQSGDAAGEEIRIKNELAELEERLGEARRDLAVATEALQAARDGREPNLSSDEPQ